MGEYFRRAKVSWDGGDVAPVPRFPVSRGDERKFKLLQVCPRNLSHRRGAPHGFAPILRPKIQHKEL
jgi:hypothetical protein